MVFLSLIRIHTYSHEFIVFHCCVGAIPAAACLWLATALKTSNKQILHTKKIIRNAEISINHRHQHCNISCVSIHFEVCVSIFSWTVFILSISYSHQYRILVVVQVYPLSIFCVSQSNKKRSLDFLFFSPSKWKKIEQDWKKVKWEEINSTPRAEHI